jgi:hypothetical protein
MSPRRSHGIPCITKARMREAIATIDQAAKIGRAAKIGTIAKTVTRKAEERREAEEKKPHSVTSMAKTKAIGQMNAPSPSKGKQSSSARIPCQQNQ